MSKYTRLKTLLDESHNRSVLYENEVHNVVNNFEKWLQEEEAALKANCSDSNYPKKGRKRNVIAAIIEKNEESESAVDSSESEDTRKRYCSGENVVQNNNTVVNNTVEEETAAVGRCKRNASKVAEAMILKQVNLSVREKMRRPDNKLEVHIKQEKLSIVPVKNDNEQKTSEFLVPKDLPRTRQKKTTRYYSSDSDNELSNVIVKKEKENNKTVRKTKTRAPSKSKQIRDTSNTKSCSDDEDDVQIQPSEHAVLLVSDSDDDTTENNDKNNSKLKKRCPSMIDKSVNESSEKTEKGSNGHENEQSVYEDAVQDQIGAASDAIKMQSCFVRLEHFNNEDANLTYDINNDSKLTSLPTNENTDNNNSPTKMLNEAVNTIMNDTVVLCKDKNSEEKREFLESTSKVLTETTSNVKNKILLFSAHEKMNESPRKSIPPVRVTRTKTRALKAAAQLINSKENLYEKNYTSQNGKDLKHQTSTNTSETLLKSNSNTKINNIVSNMDSFLPKQASAIKMLKSDLREKREEDTRKKLEREEEVLKKKEAMISAKVEEQKRRREEKALRAQQIREQKEKERQMQVELQEREKLEKLKQIQTERDNMKKELIRKRALADKRAQENEERRRAEDAIRQQRLQEQEEAEKRLEAQRKRELEEADKLHQKRLQQEEAEKLHQKRLQEIEQAKATVRAQKLAGSKTKQLMKTKKADGISVVGQSGSTKLVGKTKTILDLDTDAESEDEETTKRVIPTWSKSAYRQIALEKQDQIPDNIITSLFGSKPTSINLKEVFPNISANRLRRQSSAVWKTPPRYSLMPKFE